MCTQQATNNQLAGRWYVPSFEQHRNPYGNPYYRYYIDIEENTMQKSYIIIGTSGAATHPVVHSCLSSAESEAYRLASRNVGEEFTIYETMKSYKVVKPQPVVKVFV